MTDLLLLATEGVEGIPGEHIASKLALPLGIIIFCGAGFALLWSNYGAKKGALIYAVAWSGFCVMLGVFWWFGAPGTPVATGLQNFPGQPGNQYAPKWFGFEPGSERASFFGDAVNSFDNFQPVAEYVGGAGATEESLEGNLKFASIRGDVEGGVSRMLELHLPEDEGGGQIIGASRRERLEAAAADQLGPDETRGTPFFVEQVDQVAVRDVNGVRVAAARISTVPNIVLADGRVRTGEPLETLTWYAFKDPGALWFPSAVWTGLFFLMFLWSLWALDRIEQREKEHEEAVEEAEDVAIPVAQ